jgi:UDPglucose 6-dehydrogenase
VLSQVPPGFTRRVDASLAAHPSRRDVHVFYQAETLIFGRAVERALHPERFIVGCRQPEHELPPAYAAWLNSFGCPILRMRYESAELAKIAINLFLVSSVCATNTRAELCEAIGADWSEIAPALRLDRRIGPHAYLTPGFGYAGGNLERDLMSAKTLAQHHGTEAGVIEAWMADSRYRRAWALRQLHAHLFSSTSTTETVIALWGLAYKADTASTTNAPSLELLKALSPWNVQVYDPVVSWDGTATGSRVTQCPSALEACRGADALVIMTPWPEFSTIPPAQIREFLRGRLVLDPCGVLDPMGCAAVDVQQVRLGVPAGSPTAAISPHAATRA